MNNDRGGNTPEGVPRLYDLIKPKDPKFAPAFFKAVGTTLVAENMEQANRIAYGPRRCRVVTLTGQLIDVSGTMSGGGTNTMRGAMSAKLAADTVQPEVLRKFEKDSEDAYHELNSATAELQQLEAKRDSLKKELPEIEMALRKVEMNLNTCRSQIKEAEDRLKDLKYV